jgi:heterodisulfide reductase subunit A-like polyferredoxin
MQTQKKISQAEEPRIGVYVCHCGHNIGKVVNCPEVAEKAARLPFVASAVDVPYACSDPGQAFIRADITEKNLNRVVVASCSPRLHEPTFRRMLSDAGLNPYLLEMANLREQCSWVHMNEPENATLKAVDLVRMAAARAAGLDCLYEERVSVVKRVLVIGGGVAGIQASLDLADSGYEVVLVEKEATIGGVMALLDKTFPTIDCSI